MKKLLIIIICASIATTPVYAFAGLSELNMSSSSTKKHETSIKDQGTSVDNPDIPDNDLPNDGIIYKYENKSGLYKKYIDGKDSGKYYEYDFHNNYGRYKETVQK